MIRNNIIYIGKAKDLRQKNQKLFFQKLRISSEQSGKQDPCNQNQKHTYIITDNEIEVLTRIKFNEKT